MLKRTALGLVIAASFVLGAAPVGASTETAETSQSAEIQSGSTTEDDGYIEATASSVARKLRNGSGERRRSRTAEELRAARDAYEKWRAEQIKEHYLKMSHLPECNLDWSNTAEEWCAWQPPESGGSPRPPREAVENYVRRVTASLQLPQAYPQVGPDPDWNEWDMAVIGIPLWLWVEGDSHLTASNSDAGLAVSLDATHVSTTFQMGDGTTVTCATTKPYVRHAVAPGTPSPVCGHTYQVAPKSPSAASSSHQQPGTYTVTATTNWSVDWTAGGYSGTLATQMSGRRDLPVGELQAVVVRG